MSNTVKLYGCEIKAYSMDGVTVATAPTNNSSITFGRADGKYLKVSVAKGAAAPTGEYISADNCALAFKKVGGTETTDIYELQIKAVSDIDFIPKASVTLDSNLIFNIYLPNHECLRGVTLDGVNLDPNDYKIVDGYYHAPIKFAAKDAAKTMTLTATLNIDGTVVTGTFAFSLVNYAKSLLAAEGIKTEEQTLIKDILAYVRSAYVYFNSASSSDEEIVAIDELVVGYEDKTLSKVEDNYTNDDADILEGVTFVLEATPRIRFYLTLADGESVNDYTFKIGNSVLEIFATGTDNDTTDENFKGKTYVDISLYAYRMIENITITKNDKTSCYNIVSYVNGALDSSDEALKNIVSKFYIYCESASAYKTAIAK